MAFPMGIETVRFCYRKARFIGVTESVNTKIDGYITIVICYFPDPNLTKHPQRYRKDGVPNGNRTRVSAVKGRRPRPLDDGD